jgi:hypothetical protein
MLNPQAPDLMVNCVVRDEGSVPSRDNGVVEDNGPRDAGKAAVAAENREADTVAKEAGGEVCMTALEQRGNTGPHRIVPGQW